MSAPQHSPPDDRSFRASLVRHAVAAGSLVVLVSGAFWLVGSLGSGDTDDVPVVADTPGSDDVGESEDDDGNGDATELGSGNDDEQADDADDIDDPEDQEAPDADAGDADDGDVAQDAEDDENDEPTEPTIDPSTISVQLLDGYQTDGGTAADAVAAELEEAGYDIVARNPALRYEVTTVLWTEGFEVEGRQVAAAIGAAEAREQPGNLSSEVAVHVVVGADRG